MHQLTVEQKVVNCHVAIKMVTKLHDHQFAPSLRQFANMQLIEGGPDDPDAVGCIGGWCAQHPEFAQHGVYADPLDGAPIHTGSLFPSEVSAMLFGVDDLFDQVQDHEVGLTMKQVALQRLHVALNALQVTT